MFVLITECGVAMSDSLCLRVVVNGKIAESIKNETCTSGSSTCCLFVTALCEDSTCESRDLDVPADDNMSMANANCSCV